MNLRILYAVTVIGLLFGFGIVVYAGPVVNPTTNPGFNPYDMLPVNVGTVGQVKSGALGVSGNTAHGGVSNPITTVSTTRSPDGIGAGGQLIANMFRVMGATLFQGSVAVATPYDSVGWPTGVRNTGYALDVRSGIATNASIFTTILQIPQTGAAFFRNLVAGVSAPTDAVSREYPICVKNGNNAQTGNLTRCGGNTQIVPRAPTVTLTANPTAIVSIGNTTISWVSTDTDKCYSLSPGLSITPAGKVNGSDDSGLLRNTTTFTAMCSGPGGGVAYGSVTIPVYKPFILNEFICDPDDCIEEHAAVVDVEQNAQAGNSGLSSLQCKWKWDGEDDRRNISSGGGRWSGLQAGVFSSAQTVPLDFIETSNLQCQNFYPAGKCAIGSGVNTRSVAITMECTGTYPGGATYVRSSNRMIHWVVGNP